MGDPCATKDSLIDFMHGPRVHCDPKDVGPLSLASLPCCTMRRGELVERSGTFQSDGSLLLFSTHVKVPLSLSLLCTCGGSRQCVRPGADADVGIAGIIAGSRVLSLLLRIFVLHVDKRAVLALCGPTGVCWVSLLTWISQGPAKVLREREDAMRIYIERFEHAIRCAWGCVHTLGDRV